MFFAGCIQIRHELTVREVCQAAEVRGRSRRLRLSSPVVEGEGFLFVKEIVDETRGEFDSEITAREIRLKDIEFDVTVFLVFFSC